VYIIILITCLQKRHCINHRFYLNSETKFFPRVCLKAQKSKVHTFTFKQHFSLYIINYQRVRYRQVDIFNFSYHFLPRKNPDSRSRHGYTNLCLKVFTCKNFILDTFGGKNALNFLDQDVYLYNLHTSNYAWKTRYIFSDRFWISTRKAIIILGVV